MKINSGCLLCLASLVILPTTLAQCVKNGFSLEINECNEEEILAAYEKLLADLSIECSNTPIQELRIQLGIGANADDEATSEAIKGVCATAHQSAMKIPFKYAHRQSDVDGEFEQLYYNGGTYWNEEVETVLEIGQRTHYLKDDAQSVEDFYDTMASDTHVEWPGDLPNFDLNTCEIGAAMCCWPQDRQANDNNGNCKKQYDQNCVDKDPADNTDLCYVDMSRAPSFNKETDGFITFPDDDNDGEGAIHCHGFAWAEDDTDPSSRYKANNLFYVSMYDHMLQRGYVRNIPGAPMCGCIEQMPTATRSDCTQIDVEETYRITKKADGMTAKIESIDIDFNSCNGVNNRNNDLSAYFHQLHEDGKVSNDKRAALGKYLVENDNCEAATAYFLSTKGYLEGADYDSTVWYQFAIKGTETEISVDRSEFNEMLEESPNKIFRRICPLCADSHKEIYYRRKTPIATNRDILQKILNKWDNGNNNRFEEDYDLYSTYEDAKSGSNAWKFCNGSNKKGFPSECGPTGYVANQHSRFDNNSGQTNVVFLVEKASESSTDGGDESSTDISDTSPDNGDSLSLDSSDSSPDNDDESPPDSGESALNNYDFYQGKDSSGKNIRNLLNEAQGAGVEYVEYYAEWCNQRPACKGFNSNGWVKKAIRNQKKWSNTNEPDKGLYVKKV